MRRRLPGLVVPAHDRMSQDGPGYFPNWARCAPEAGRRRPIKELTVKSATLTGK